MERDLDHCDGCKRRFGEDRPPAPMLQDHVWRKLADERDLLCADCMFRRAAQRGLHLTLASLKPLPVNLKCNPWSWFDLFLTHDKNMLPKGFDMQAWRKAAEVYPPSMLPDFFKRHRAPDEVQLEWGF